MEQQKVKQSIEEILEESHVGTMATVKNGKPYTRYMTFFHDDLILYTATSKETDKAEELEENPHTHILLGYEGEEFGDEYVEYEGKVSIKDTKELKDKLWNESMEQWFDGKDDPNLIILQIEPDEIKLMNKNDLTPKTLSLK